MYNSQQLENSGGLPLKIYLNLDVRRLLLRQFFGRNDASQWAEDKHPNIHIYERLLVLSTMLYSTVFGFLIIFAWRSWKDEAHQEDLDKTLSHCLQPCHKFQHMAHNLLMYVLCVWALCVQPPCSNGANWQCQKSEEKVAWLKSD